MIPRLLSGVLIGLLVFGLSGRAAEKFALEKLDLNKLPPASSRKGLTYAKDIRPMLEASCFRCHGADQQKGQLRLDSLESLLKGGEHGKVVVPGKGKESHLVIAVARIDDETAMPPKRRPGNRGGPGGQGGPGGVRGPSGSGRPGGPPPPGNSAGAGGAGGARSGGPRGGGAPPTPLTAEQVGIIRAWVEQGAK